MSKKKVFYGVGTLLGVGVTAVSGYGLYKEIKADKVIPMQPVDAIEGSDDENDAEEAE